MDRDKGVVYLALNSPDIFEEVKGSAKSLKKSNNSLPITVFTNLSVKKPKYIDQIISYNSHFNPFKAKVDILRKSPYELTFFLDSDTIVFSSILDCFSYLTSNDLVLAKKPKMCDGMFEDFEDPLHFNTGMIGYKKNANVTRIFDFWMGEILKFDDKDVWSAQNCDQTIFNEKIVNAGYLAKIKYCILDNKVWNVRPVSWNRLSGSEKKRVIVFHGRFTKSIFIKQIHYFYNRLISIINDLGRNY